MKYIPQLYLMLFVMMLLAQPQVLGLSTPSRKAPKGYSTMAQPFLKKHCVSCHGERKQKAELSLHDINTDFSNKEAVDLWKMVLRYSLLGQMPPENKERPGAGELEQFVTWIDNTLVEAGHASMYHDIVTKPDYGNYVNHEALFSGQHQGPAYSPSRLWRKNSYNGNKALSLPTREGIKDYAVEGYIDEPTINSIMAVLGNHFETRLKGGNIKKGKFKAKGQMLSQPYVDFIEASSSSKKLEEAAVAYAFQDNLKREVQPEELSHYVDMLQKNVAHGGRLLGLKMTVMAVQLQPEALFRMELGLGKSLPDGRRRLSSQEIYFAIAYGLGDTVQSGGKGKKSISSLLRKAQLDSRNGVKEVLTKILEDDSIAKPRIFRFFLEFFSYESTATLFKDFKTSYGQRKKMMADAQLFVENILQKDKKVFEELLSSSEYPLSMMGGKHFQYLEHTYSIPRGDYKKIDSDFNKAKKNRKAKKDVDESALNPTYDFKNKRAGMVTHPAWLFAHASNDENHPVHRGKWVLERLLAGTVPAVPVNVQAQIPEDEHRTLRQRFDVVKEEYCWGCHKKMNPLGMPFEVYSFVGAEQTKDAGQAVDASADFSGTGIPDMEGVKVKNAVELMQVLAQKKRVRQSIIRHAFRYWMGRNETLNDSPTLMAADKAYVESGGSFKAVLVALLSSDSFLYRK